MFDTKTCLLHGRLPSRLVASVAEWGLCDVAMRPSMLGAENLMHPARLTTILLFQPLNQSKILLTEF
jgi:hypothetical protein